MKVSSMNSLRPLYKACLALLVGVLLSACTARPQSAIALMDGKARVVDKTPLDNTLVDVFVLYRGTFHNEPEPLDTELKLWPDSSFVS